MLTEFVTPLRNLPDRGTSLDHVCRVERILATTTRTRQTSKSPDPVRKSSDALKNGSKHNNMQGSLPNGLDPQRKDNPPSGYTLLSKRNFRLHAAGMRTMLRLKTQQALLPRASDCSSADLAQVTDALALRRQARILLRQARVLGAYSRQHRRQGPDGGVACIEHLQLPCIHPL